MSVVGVVVPLVEFAGGLLHARAALAFEPLHGWKVGGKVADTPKFALTLRVQIRAMCVYLQPYVCVCTRVVCVHVQLYCGDGGSLDSFVPRMDQGE